MSGFCRWPGGCPQPVSLLAGEGLEDDLCSYHWKVVRGLIDSRTMVRSHGARRAPQIKGSDVVSDEQREMANMLRKMGASEGVVQQALTKEIAAGHGGRATYGSGMKRGRIREGTY